MNFISRIKDWFKDKKLVQSEIITPTPTHQVDQRDIETRKRVKAAFKAQESQMNSRALKAHDSSCKDELTCKKKVCFKWQPDKIVSSSYEVTHEMRINEEKQRQFEKRANDPFAKKIDSFFGSMINGISNSRDEIHSSIELCLEYGKNKEFSKMKGQIDKIKNSPNVNLKSKELQKIIIYLELIASSEDDSEPKLVKPRE